MTRKINVMGDDFEDRWRKKEMISFCKSSSTSRQVDMSSDSVEETSYYPDFCDSCLAKMDKETAHLEPSPKGVRNGQIRAKKNPRLRFSLWRITTTKTHEGHSSQAECGPQKQHEPLLMKQLAEYNKMAKELEHWTTEE